MSKKTTTNALEFGESDTIGAVAAVDTSRVQVSVDDSSIVSRIGVGNLIAIRGSTETEFLIGIVDRVTRTVKEEMLVDYDEKETIETAPLPDDTVRVVLVGTYRTIRGEEKDVFKRGADAFPQIDRSCYLIQGENLQRFMGLLGSRFKPGEQLALGHFVIDSKAEAIASGDRFFQRHASILGSTGSGKSWSVALILEKASQLAHPNVIVLDMHGEYAPLTDQEKGGFAQGFRIAGPGDLASPTSDRIFLPYWLLNREEMLSMILDRNDQNAPNQASRFTSHVRKLKDKSLKDAGKDSVRETFTVDSPIPYSADELVALLETDDTTKGVG
ncbi:MAG: DUF87 domain-containing protein, partial [Planctomycetota bacterium]